MHRQVTLSLSARDYQVLFNDQASYNDRDYRSRLQPSNIIQITHLHADPSSTLECPYISVVTSNQNKYQKPNNYLKINRALNTINEQVVITSKGVTSSTIFYMNRKYTPLFESLQTIMKKVVKC